MSKWLDWENMKKQTYYEYAEEKRALENAMHERNVAMAQSIMGAQDPLGNFLTGVNQQYASAYNGVSNSPRPAAPTIVGQLVWKGVALPLDWRGCEYKGWARALIDCRPPHWRITFDSLWTSDQIHFYVSADEHTGNEADAMAKTFLEVINQRRLG